MMIVALGVLANMLFIGGCFFRLSRHVMISAVLGNVCYIFYYFLLGLYAPIIGIAVGTISFLVAIASGKKQIIRITAFAAATAISFLIILNMQNFMDISILIAAWLIALAQINRESYIRYKIYAIASQTLWVVFSIYHLDYAMLTTCIFIITSTSFSLVRNMLKDGYLSKWSIESMIFQSNHFRKRRHF